MDIKLSQPGILAPPPACGRSLSFRLGTETDPRKALERLRSGITMDHCVIGLGEPLVRALGVALPELRSFPSLSGPGCAVPATQSALWVFLRGTDAGSLFDATEQLEGLTDDMFVREDTMDTFTYAGGRDLSGYIDGTANPSAEDSVGVALVAAGDGLVGSSFVAVQRWSHDLASFRAHSTAQRDAMIGRRRDTNEEIADAPASAHVKRSAQEEFSPTAFMVRRSMPWALGDDQGLEFIAYGHSLDAFEQVLRRMIGLDDGITDALFRFSRPLRGGYYWCPPVVRNRLDLTRLGL